MHGAARRCGRATCTSLADMNAPSPVPRSSHPAVWLTLHVLLVFTYVTATRPVHAFPATDSPKQQSNVRLALPPFHIALSGDLHVQVTAPPSSANLYIKLLRQEGNTLQSLANIAIIPDARSLTTNTTLLRLPCGLFSRGGSYIVRVMKQEFNATNAENYIQLLSRQLDVRWPSPKLTLTPNHVETYPDEPVTATLEFPEVVCPPIGNEHVPSAIPEFWLELHFCGPSTLSCDSQNSTAQVLYSEQMRGFPGRHDITLRCELFGLAGHYALVLRPTSDLPSPVSTNAVYLKADWSEQFVFNVHARSIFPCDSLGGGVAVLFQYPACILNDRVRLFARLRADVSALAPPTTLEYVAEKRFARGVHSIHFDCDLFTERYVEYCFTYVSQAITGAVADVRMDCVPTLPVAESDTGGWGEWSSWTPCTTSCSGGTRNRYRFCDSPPPRYGAKFCEGPAVETEKCGGSELTSNSDASLSTETNNNSDASGNDETNSVKDVSAVDWECIYGVGDSVNGDVPADRPEVKAEVGFGCRCGCVVHLGKSKPRRLVATSSQSCPGRTFWLIQADKGHVVRFKVDHIRLPCNSQWLKIRDGNSLSATLVQQLIGTPAAEPPSAIVSSGPRLLLEFFSDELFTAGGMCGGGFLAHAQQILPQNENSTIIRLAVAQGAVVMSPVTTVRLTVVHIVALIFVTVVLLVSVTLVAQYILRYRKYQLAEDMDSLADLSGEGSTMNLAIPIRVGSSSTLLSEVISLTRLRPKLKPKHTRLRESAECETTLTVDQNEDSETPVEEEKSIGSTTTLQQEIDTTVTTTTTALATNTEDVISPSDTITAESLPSSPKSSPMRKSTTFSPTEQRSKDNIKYKNNQINEHPNNERDKSETVPRRFSNASNSTLTNGCYSPALSSVSSTATIRTTNQKENKEKKNRERLLAGQGSEFSLNGPDTDLELDYYDYNVVNAGAAPGSYLGMDPAFLVWIPPLDDSGEILNNLEENPEQIYKEIQSQQHVDPGSNTESPDGEIILTGKLRIRSISDVSDDSRETLKRVHQSKMIIPSSVKISDVDICAKSNGQIQDASILNKHASPDQNKNNFIPMQEFTKAKEMRKNDAFAKVHHMKEKETKVEKSPTKDYCKVNIFLKENNDEIKFADDDDDEDKCNIEKNNLKTASSCTDINIIASHSS